MKDTYSIILFYKYIDIDDPKKLRDEQRDFCRARGITGRTIVSSEGINGTYEGTTEAINEYIAYMNADPRFADIDFKVSKGTGDAFPRLSIKARKEIVSTHLGKHDVDPRIVTGTHLTPQEFHDLLHSDEEVYLVDMRNDFEQKVGMFRGALESGMKYFRDLPKTAKKLSHLKDKKVITYCTGGIRCEKASGYLKTQGFKDVYQLKGGIVRYLEEFDGEDFDGRLYVFDKRKVMDRFTKSGVMGKCDKCKHTCEDYVNCSELSCNRHFLCCNACLDSKGHAFCNVICHTKFATKAFFKKLKKLFRPNERVIQ